MADSRSEPGELAPATEDTIPEQAASLAVQISEAQAPEERRRLAARFAAAARSGVLSGARATGRGARATGRGARATGRGARATGRGVRATRRETQATRRETQPTRRGVQATRRGIQATGRAVRATGRGVRATRRRVGAGTGWLAAQVVAMAPRLRVRDQAALRAQFPGMQAEEIADALIEGASRASAAVGGAVGAWAALPVLPAFPAEIATETLAMVGIEIKLVAELHEAYGMPAPGSGVERMSAYVAAWAHRRGVFMVPGGLILAAGSPLARRLRWRLAGRASRSVFSLGPLFTGAVAGATLNRRETRRLGQDVRADLRRGAQAADHGTVAPRARR